MKNVKRMLALAGMTLAAGAMLGITPAQAAPATAQTPGTVALAGGNYWDWDDEYVVGYYYDQWQCNRAGGYAENHRVWGDYYCFPAWVPGWGSVWVLQVEEDHWYWNKWNGGWPSAWPYRPNIVGQSFQVGGPYQHPFKYRTGIRYGTLNGIPFNPYQRYNGPRSYFDNPSYFHPPYQKYHGASTGYPLYKGA